MFQIEQSALFLRQWQEFTHNYNKRAGKSVAVKFVLAVEEAQTFIANNPYACMVYDAGGEFPNYKFRKWSLHKFPHVILFRVKDADTIIIDAIYAHKMDIGRRFEAEIERLKENKND